MKLKHSQVTSISSPSSSKYVAVGQHGSEHKEAKSSLQLTWVYFAKIASLFTHLSLETVLRTFWCVGIFSSNS
jgi:hypothetical protein